MILTLTENQVLILTEYNEAAEDELLLKHKIKQALRNSCELLRRRKELHASSGNFMQAHVTA